MGGGKETPRQKMISMMYIVLTALLALNVSKQILDAFVAIEANIQKGALTQLERGNELKSDLKEELSNSDGEDGAAKRIKIETALKSIAEIDKETQLVIKNIDDAKLLLLEKLGELNKTPKDQDKDAILWVKYSENEPLRPSKLNLTALQSKDEFDTPMRELGVKELENIDKAGVGMKKVWEPYKNYRKRIVEICGTKSVEGKKYVVKLNGSVDAFKDNKDLQVAVSKLIYKGNKVDPADSSDLITLYSELTKNELDEYGHDGDIQKNVHWLGRTFYHSPMIAALASLSTLQYEVLSARSKAVGMIKSRISTGTYSFNKILGMAYPETAVLNPNENFTVSVFMAAFDTDKQPQVRPNQGKIKEIKDGVALLDMTASGSGEMQISGTVGIADKMGNVKWKDYNTKVTIATKGGSLEMPEFAILYKNYGNIVIPSASGAVSTSLSAPGCQVTPTTFNGRKGYKVKPTGGTQVKLTLSGKDRLGKSVSYGQWTYRLKSMPKPQFTTQTISKSGGRVTVSLEGSPLAATFTYQGVETDGGGLDWSGSGNVIPASALAKVRVGKKVAVTLKVVNSLTGLVERVDGNLKVTN